MDSVLGGMLEADVSIREENNENLENFTRGDERGGDKGCGGGQLMGHQSFSPIFDPLPLDNKGIYFQCFLIVSKLYDCKDVEKKKKL